MCLNSNLIGLHACLSINESLCYCQVWCKPRVMGHFKGFDTDSYYLYPILRHVTCSGVTQVAGLLEKIHFGHLDESAGAMFSGFPTLGLVSKKYSSHPPLKMQFPSCGRPLSLQRSSSL